MKTISEKINYLSNIMVVTEESLFETMKLQHTAKLNTNEYLAFNAVMIDVMRTSPVETVNFLKYIIRNIDISSGFLNSIKSIADKHRALPTPNLRVEHLTEVFGRYFFSKGSALLDRIDSIEKCAVELA
ncbi:hypothetical protein ABEY43_06115 [Priestia megaterium]